MIECVFRPLPPLGCFGSSGDEAGTGKNNMDPVAGTSTVPLMLFFFFRDVAIPDRLRQCEDIWQTSTPASKD